MKQLNAYPDFESEKLLSVTVISIISQRTIFSIFSLLQEIHFGTISSTMINVRAVISFEISPLHFEDIEHACQYCTSSKVYRINISFCRFGVTCADICRGLKSRCKYENCQKRENDLYVCNRIGREIDVTFFSSHTVIRSVRQSHKRRHTVRE